MKTILSGIFTVVIIGAIALLILRARGLVKFPSEITPSPTPVASANFEFASPAPSSSPKVSPKPTIKPGVKEEVKGTSTSSTSSSVSTSIVTTTTTKTVSHVKLTLVKSDKCPTTAVAEVSDIEGNLTIKYSLKDNYTANITAWKSNGEEVIKQTRVEDSGDLKTIEGLSYLKLQVQSDHCVNSNAEWITVTAER